MSDQVWHVAVNGKQEGPYSAEEVTAKISNGQLDRRASVYGPGTSEWVPIASRSEFAGAFGTASPPPPPPSTGQAHEIDYEVHGEEMQFVEITLDPGEACIAEAGSFMYMDPGIEMETIFGDGSAQSSGGGFMGALLGAGKRILTGESLFMTLFGNGASGRQTVAFAAPYPGRIVPIDLETHGTILCQFLRSAEPIWPAARSRDSVVHPHF